jgi:hypothetical protein
MTNDTQENVYLLAKAFAARSDLASTWDVSAIFISNAQKTVS